jgi:hypothetical protein
MIKSRHNTFGFWLLAGMMLFLTFLAICSVTQFYFHFTIIRIDVHSQRSFNGQVIIDVIGCLIFGSMLSSRASFIQIHSDGGILKTISFKKLFTRRTKVYSFQEFDGYITTQVWHKQWNENKTLCLIKEGRVVTKIDNFFYSNVDELQEALKEMPYLGFKNMGIVNSWKVLFNKPIL